MTSVDSGTVVAERTVARLKTTFQSRRTRPLKWRHDQLAGIERFLSECESDIADALAQDLRRTGFDAWLADIAATAAEAKFTRKNVKSWMRPTRVPVQLNMHPATSHIRYEPLGVALVIGAWNYPVHLTLAPVIGAIAAGNCVIIKPSEHAPATAAMLSRLLPRYLDPEAVAVVEGDAETTKALIDQGLDHILYTGGSEVGKQIMAAAAPHLTPVTLELGGKCPVIVTRNTDLAVAARRIVWTKVLNSGQTCVAPDYVLADRAIMTDLVTEIVKAATDFTDGDGSTAKPIVNQRQTTRLAKLLARHGGEVAHGGNVDLDDCTVDFTVITDPDPHSDLMQQEIFGPILPIVGIGALDDAFDYIANRPKPLAAYLFSTSRSEQDRFLDETTSGGVCINNLAFHAMTPRLPFGGVGASGTGSYHGKWGFDTFSHRKAVLKKTVFPDLPLIYPPYSEIAERILRWIF